MSISLILIIILIIILIGGVGGPHLGAPWPYAFGYGANGVSILGLLLVVLIILALLGKI
jgi:Protein of unknown function (DUF3309)